MAIEPVPALTTVPPFPGLPDRAAGTYNSKAYNFGTHMADVFNGEIEALADNVKNNADEALANAVLAQTSGDLVVLAQAAANFKGNWSALTGALNMPASVAYGGDYWALNANTSNVASDVPGVSVKWSRLRSGPGGATESTGGGILLTTASARVQAITTTAADQTITLPAAFGITTGGEIFFIENTGTFQFIVRNNVGEILIALDPGQGAMFYLRNNSTQGGSWSVRLSQGPLSHTIYQATGVTINAESTQGVSITALSPTTAILTYRVAAQGWACVLTIAGTSVTVGVLCDLGNSINSSVYISVTSMSATTAMIAYTIAATLYVGARFLTVTGTGSGATITLGAIATINAVASAQPEVVSVSATQAVVAYIVNSTQYLTACTLNVSGTSITAGAVNTIRSNALTGFDICTMWTSQVLMVSGAAAGGMQAVAVNITGGTSLSAGAALTVSPDSVWAGVTSLSSTQALVFYQGNLSESHTTRVLTVSGTTTTAGPVTSQHAYAVTSSSVWYKPALARLSPTRVIESNVFPGAGTGFVRNARVQLLGVIDGAVEHGKDSVLKSAYSDMTMLAALSSTKAIAAYTQASGYVQVRVLEIGL